MTATDTLLLPRITAEPEERRYALGFRPDIQGLRAVAVMLVLFSHAGLPFLAGGYVGVDVFFVLSGFLITSLLVKEVFETGRISIAGFYARRARRILPAASAVTIATAIGAWLFFPVTRLEAVMQDALAVVVYVVNYRFVAEQTEYLNADQMPSPFQQFWSLAVEEQFYVVWPLLLLGLLFMMGRKPKRLVTAWIVVSALIFAATLALSVTVTAASQPTAYYAAHTRAWELAAGALLALTLPSLKRIPTALAWILGLGGLTAILASGFLYTESTPFPGYAALAPVLGTAAVIAAGSGRGRNAVSSLLSTGPFQFFGQISYSLYLWHWPILILTPLALEVDATLRLNLVLLTTTIAIAQLSYMYIEEPIRNAGRLKRSHLAGIGTGVGFMAACVAVVLALTHVFVKAPADDGTADLDDVQAVNELSELEQMLKDGLEVDNVPADLTPSLTGAVDDRPVIYDDGCHLKYEDVELPDDCVYGDTESDVDVILFGDSHAAQWFPALESIAADQGWRLVSRTKSSCTAANVHVKSTQYDGEYTECWDWRQQVFEEIEATAPELVILGSYEETELSEGQDRAVEAWTEGWTSTVESLSAAGEVAFIADTPSATDVAAPDCLALNTDSVQTCLEEDPYKIQLEDLRKAGTEALEDEGAVVVDTEPWFCLDGDCPLIVENLSVYRDNHHVSTPYAASLTPLLQEALPDPRP